MVIGRRRAAPGTVTLADTQTDTPIITNDIITGRLLAGGLKNLTAPFCSNLTDKSMNGNAVNGMVTGAVFIWRNQGVGC